MSKRTNQSQSSQAHDMFQNLLNTPMQSPANSSSAPQTSHPSPSNMVSQGGFAPFAVNPFSQPFYHQTGYSSIPPQFYHQQNFPQYQPHPQFQAQYQNVETPPDNQFEVEGEGKVEVDPNKKGKRKQTRWTDDEEVILAQRSVSSR